jgi:ABC-type Fe3+/spermidine/putrescine transport system ATPase subunit
MILEVKNIQLSFSDRKVLKDVNLSLSEGRIISIVGRSGAGKTSLLKILSGNLDPEKGEIHFEGKRVKGPLSKLIPGHEEICLVNQDFKLDEFHTVEENILLQILGLPQQIRDKFVEELLELLELEGIRRQKARDISGGEQQRLALARVLAREPKVILLDEPFSHLDTRLRKKLINYLLELKSIRGTSIVLVSHDGSEVLALSDCIYFMKNGRLIKKGSPEKVYYRPSTIEEARMFGAMNSVRVGEERYLFRPDEYSLHQIETAPLLELEFLGSVFTGPVHENSFKTSRGEKVVLFSFIPLRNVTRCWIERKTN